MNKGKIEGTKPNKFLADEYGHWNFIRPKIYNEEEMKYAYEQGARLALISQSPLALHKGEFPTPQEWINEFNK